ncbi:MAG TPA: PspC domain-containing protein [Candidatus Kapabacteria bacterium]|nr:PspC domain-containing protein [Candidatus Kapabacteria bacterium]
MDTTRRLYRLLHERWIAGVAAGIAEYFGISPVLVRFGFVVLTVFFGFGVPLYLVAWLAMPKRDDIVIRVTEENEFELRPHATFIGGVIKAFAVLTLAGITMAIASEVADSGWGVAFVLGLAIGLFFVWKSRGFRSPGGGDGIGLHRSPNNRKIFGVCGGLAERMNLDPTIVRLATVVLVLVGMGILVPVYFLFAILLPNGARTIGTVERVVIV